MKISSKKWQGLKKYKQLVIDSLNKVGLTDYADRMSKCSEIMYAVQGKCGKKKTVHYTPCKLRYCPVCGVMRRDVLLKKYSESVANMNSPYLLTLTTTNKQHISKKFIGVLNSWFHKLRFSKFFHHKKGGHVTGGFKSIEVKYGKNGGYWHVHLHNLIDVPNCFQTIREYINVIPFFDMPEQFTKPTEKFFHHVLENQDNINPHDIIPVELIPYPIIDLLPGKAHTKQEHEERKAAQNCPYWLALFQMAVTCRWYMLTGDSYIVNIKRADEKARLELFKYITKVLDFTHDENYFLEFCRSVDGMRLIQSFGDYYNRKFEDDCENEFTPVFYEEDADEVEMLSGRFHELHEEKFTGKKYIKLKCKDCTGCSAYLCGDVNADLIEQAEKMKKFLKFHERLKIVDKADSEIEKKAHSWKTPEEMSMEEFHRWAKYQERKLERDAILLRNRELEYYFKKHNSRVETIIDHELKFQTEIRKLGYTGENIEPETEKIIRDLLRGKI